MIDPYWARRAGDPPDYTWVVYLGVAAAMQFVAAVAI